ncbi:hypothetical protein KBB05_04025 [Patescibacteria group bacterium]|nr:hypothetical protein [Patescibacteria group bacterium]
MTISTSSKSNLTNVLVQQKKEDEVKLLEHSKSIQAFYTNKIKEFAIV